MNFSINSVVLFFILLIRFNDVNADQLFFHDNPISLETDIWNQDDLHLFELEKKATQALQINPQSSFNLYLLSHVYMRIFVKESQHPSDPYFYRYLKKSLELAKESYDENHSDEIGYIALASMFEVMGEKDKARLIINKIPSNVAKTWRRDFIKIRLNAGDQEPKTILADLESLYVNRESNKEILSPFLIRAIITCYNNDEQIVSFIEQLKNQTELTEQLSLFLARKKIDLGKNKEAHDIYQGILEENPFSLNAILQLGIIEYNVFHNTDEAIILLLKSLFLYKDDFSPSAKIAKALISMHLAAAYLQKNETVSYSMSQDLFYQTIINNPDFFDIFSNFAIIAYTREKRPKELAILLTDLTKKMPEKIKIFVALGNVLSMDIKDYEFAISAYSSALILEPNNPQTMQLLALTYYKIKNYLLSLNLFEKALIISPKNPTILYNKACLLALLNKFDESINTLKQAVIIDPTLKQMAKSDEDFENLRNREDFKQIFKP